MTRMGHITRAGSSNLRWILVEAMHSHLMNCKAKDECRLCRFHKRIERRRKGKAAVVAGAAKLLRIMYWMLKLNLPYHPQGLDLRSAAEGEPRVLE